MHPHDAPSPSPPTPRWREPLRISFWLFLGLAMFYLVLEHRVHLLGAAPWLPFLFLAACPLMHLFGHGGHGHHGHHHHDPADATTSRRDTPPSGPTTF